jgi:hypothetical protein
MLRGLVGVVLAVALGAPPTARAQAVILAAAGPAASSRHLALAASEARHVLDVGTGALPPAPGKVLLKTRSFGSVTLDHPAHLARRIACKTCHGPGPVSKPVYTPKTAHDTCVSCHREQKRGPTSCRDCHVVPGAPQPGESSSVASAGRDPAAPDREVAKPQAPAATGALAARGGEAVMARASVPSATTDTVAGGAPSPPPGAGAEQPNRVGGALVVAEPPVQRGFMRGLGLGYSAIIADGDVATALAFSFTAREDGFLLVHTIERTVSAPKDAGRTLGLIGPGVAWPLHPRWNVLAIGLGGFDAPEKPTVSFLPAVGARLGVEWLGARTSVNLAATLVYDVVHSTNALGQEAGGFTASISLTGGLLLDRSP